MTLAHTTREAIGRLYKALPSAIVAIAMRPSLPREDLPKRVADVVGQLKDAGANLESEDPEGIAEHGTRVLEARNVVVAEKSRLRVRDRFVLRYYARTLEHLLNPPKRARTH